MPTPSVLTGKLFLHPPTWHLAEKRNFQPSSNSLPKLPTAWIWILLIQDQCCAWEQYSQNTSEAGEAHSCLPAPWNTFFCTKAVLLWAATSTALTSRGLALAEAGPSPCLEAVTNPGTQLTANLPLLLTELTHTLLPHKQLQEGTSQTEGQQKAVWIHVYWSQ